MPGCSFCGQYHADSMPCQLAAGEGVDAPSGLPLEATKLLEEMIDGESVNYDTRPQPQF